MGDPRTCTRLFDTQHDNAHPESMGYLPVTPSTSHTHSSHIETAPHASAASAIQSADGHRYRRDDDLIAYDRSRDSFWQISEDRRCTLQGRIIQHVPHWILPSRHALSRYYKSYMEQFHKHYPILHTASLVIETAPVGLSLAVAAIGAQYRFDFNAALALYKAAKSATEDRLERAKQQQGGHGPEGMALSVLLRPPLTLCYRSSCVDKYGKHLDTTYRILCVGPTSRSGIRRALLAHHFITVAS